MSRGRGRMKVIDAECRDFELRVQQSSPDQRFSVCRIGASVQGLAEARRSARGRLTIRVAAFTSTLVLYYRCSASSMSYCKAMHFNPRCAIKRAARWHELDMELCTVTSAPTEQLHSPCATPQMILLPRIHGPMSTIRHDFALPPSML